VVQFGLAMMPFGGLIASAGFTSETTSGTSGSIRQQDELSTTIPPAAATLGANSLDAVLPALKMAISRPAKSATAMSSTVMSSPRQSSFLPADRDDAKYRISSTGKLRSASSVRMTLPT